MIDRSSIMRAVRSRDTTPELIVRRAATALGYRYRLHKATLPGKPDLVFASRRKAIFVHGCFWHGHDCKRGAREPKSNVEYWRAKVQRNRDRDTKTIAALGEAGWDVLIVWECETRESDRLNDRLRRFLS
jgi:DNA mismatch endonuclease (patch repair protein)